MQLNFYQNSLHLFFYFLNDYLKRLNFVKQNLIFLNLGNDQFITYKFV